MLEFFVIFSKSGIVLFATVNQSLEQIINGLVKQVFLEERTGQYQTDQLMIKYLLDNEFELIYVVGYQKLLQLDYVDKFLTEIQLAFRDKYPDFDLQRIIDQSFNVRVLKPIKQSGDNSTYHKQPKLNSPQSRLNFCDLVIDQSSMLKFEEEFEDTYKICVLTHGKSLKQETMRTFQDSAKSKKTIASMVVSKKPDVAQPPPPAPAKVPVVPTPLERGERPTKKPKKAKDSAPPAPKGKAARQWDLSGSNPAEFDFSKKTSETTSGDAPISVSAKQIASTLSPQDLETNLELTDSEEDDEIDEMDQVGQEMPAHHNKSSSSSLLGSIWKNISYNKNLTEEDLKPVLEQLRDHLTAKNVAAEIAEDLCTSVGKKLEGQNVNTWVNLKKLARDALQESVLNILSPNRAINILREIQAKPRPPYVITFCGVNGVGKSTNLAKIANWLINNNVKVLVVACDTFRAGAIEQLKTHVMALKSLHERGKNAPVKIELFEKGYGRDSAAIAMEAINYGRNNQFNCVLVDTAGRMQDNEPLMRQLAKLIKINTPDLTLFVGEALVGNEAVDQLTKFNKSLLDCGCRVEGSTRSAIDGIVLTKFDTIDDQVGAAISMTYVTGQPIVFVGVGQTYRDLKQLNAKAVTKALMR